IKLEIFITAIRRMNSYIIIYSCSTEIRAGKAIIQGSICANGTGTNRAFHKDAVTRKEIFKFPEYPGIFLQELFKLLKSDIVKISFKSTDAANIGRQP